MSYYLIGIGGTGARCVDAFIHLCGANLLKDDKPIYIVNADPDGACGNLEEAEVSLEYYEKAYAMNCKAVFRNKIEKLGYYGFVPDGEGTLDDVFDSSLMVTNNPTLHKLYEAMFTPEERKTDLKVGFHGHPVIGAAVVGLTMDLDHEPAWKALSEKLSVDDEPRVFLFASVFGGTGASGFPNIAKILKACQKTNQDGDIKMKLGGCLVLPYFSFGKATSEVEARNEIYAKADEFIYNTTEALKYYDTNKLVGDVFDTVYMVGDYEKPNQGDFSLGGSSQRNVAHFIELYAALAAYDFFNKSDEELKNFTHPMIATKTDKIHWDDLPNPLVSGDLQRKLSTYIRFLYAYRKYTFGHLEKCHQNRNNAKSIAFYKNLVQDAGKVDIYEDNSAWGRFTALNEYVERFFDWLRQITDNKRCDNLVNRQVFDEKIVLEPYQIVYPITEQKDKLTEHKIYQELSKYKPNNPTSSGAGILLEALYEICDK